MDDMPPTTPTVSDSARRVAYRYLLGFTALVAAVTFTLSFHGLDGYGRDVAGIPVLLSWLVPVGVDGLTLCAVAATFILRHDRWKVRAYAWLVFAIAVALSVAGNVEYAAARHLPPMGQGGAAAWPILLALASHLVVFTRRSMDRRTTPETSQPEPVPAGQEPEAATEKKTLDPKTYARQQVGRGKNAVEVARLLVERGHDVSERQVQRWTQDIQQRRRAESSPEPGPATA
jgi:hypothetical protein